MKRLTYDKMNANTSYSNDSLSVLFIYIKQHVKGKKV
jgi:hypothetical protein